MFRNENIIINIYDLDQILYTSDQKISEMENTCCTYRQNGVNIDNESKLK